MKKFICFSMYLDGHVEVKDFNECRYIFINKPKALLKYCKKKHLKAPQNAKRGFYQWWEEYSLGGWVPSTDKESQEMKEELINLGYKIKL